ncbi:hypothetical protein [Micromonospora sp. RTP1Z1]|uniref:hypothetical protein n=1 Tax=Micromonospora sp. RTP1Z1 TaxID=2994043 RepID=UPI0029C68F2C|nr:hypothetical protein [Micromonospora sp. RTP1Z1]
MTVRQGAGVFWRWWAAGTTSLVGSAVGAVALAPLALLLSPVRRLRDLTDLGIDGPTAREPVAVAR